MKRSVLYIALILLLLLLAAGLAGCSSTPKEYEFSEDRDQGSLVLYVFWGDGCSHCEAAKPMLAKLDEEFPDLNIRSFEIWYNETNAGLFNQMGDQFKLPEGGRGTPTFFLGNRYWVGYSEEIGKDIETTIKTCTETGCPDAGAGTMPGASQEVSNTPATPGGMSEVLNVPLIGKVDLSQQSMWISTALIAIVDGVNPCSVWVLTMLLALTLHTGSRKKIAVIGVIFLTVTALIYALFIAGLFTVLKITSFIGWIQVVVALLALFFAMVNIKDYFWYKEGLSFTIADEKKPGIFQNIRKIMDASHSFWGLAGATVLMAAGVSLVEFSCTAGFPVLWTNLLVSQKVGTAFFIILLILYMFIYQLDELVIFFTAVFSLKASKLEEKQGRILKLIGGMLMLTLAFVMLVNPEWMNSLSSSLIIFAVAFALTLLVLLLHRKILPSFGVWIGSEAQSKSKPKKRRSKK
jgi:thiol-disulfide isomerase/thioredoxin